MPPATNGAGGFSRSPISTPSGIELLWIIAWYRSKAKIKKIFESDYAETSPSRPYTRELPQELVEMIITHVLLDTPTLKACSATCRSWYIATLPHLHYTLTLRHGASDPARRGLKPLQKLSKMRLPPYVTRLRMVLNYAGPSPPTVINARSPGYFSVLTNVQELSIDALDFRDLAPQMELYFGRFAPKLQTLALDSPRGARRDLLSFIGLFPNLDNFKLRYDRTDGGIPGHSPVLQPAPSMRGCLTMRLFGGERFLRDLSELCGGLRFHSVDLAGEDGAQFLLDICAETLETLRIRPHGWTGDHEPVRQKFILSKCRSLRSLELTVVNMIRPSNLNPSFLGELLSTITSSVFSEVVMVLEDSDVHDVIPWGLFSVVRSMYEVKPFHLVFSLEIWEGDRKRATERFKRLIDAEAAKGGLDFLPCPPVIAFNTRAARDRFV